MAEQNSKKRLYAIIGALVAIIAIILGLVAACSPQNGKDGSNGTDGADGDNGTDGTPPVEEDLIPELPTVPAGSVGAVAYASVHGDEIITNQIQTVGWKVDPVLDVDGNVTTPGEQYLIPLAGLYMSDGTTQATQCTTADAKIQSTATAIAEVIYGPDSGYDFTAHLDFPTQSWFANNPAEPDMCILPIDKQFTMVANDTFMVSAGLGQGWAQINDQTGAVEETNVNETEWQEDEFGARQYVVRELLDYDIHSLSSYRVISEEEADTFTKDYKYDVKWKKDNAGYMGGLWQPTIAELEKIFIGKTYVEAVAIQATLEDGTLDWADGISGVSGDMLHDYHYTAVILEAIRLATIEAGLPVA